MISREDVRRVFRAAGAEHQQTLRDEAAAVLEANRAQVEAWIAELDAGGGVYDHERAPERDSDLPGAP